MLNKRTLVLIGLLLLGGCYCKKCVGQTFQNVFNGDTIVTATESLAFSQLQRDYQAVFGPVAYLNEVHKSAFNAPIVQSMTATVTITQAQSKRWIDPSDNNSMVTRLCWQIINAAIKGKCDAPKYVIGVCKNTASLRIKDAQKLQRFLDKLNTLKENTQEEY